MGKNNKIVAVFILQVLQLPDPWPKDQPRYYFRSGTVTRHQPEIFLACYKFVDCRKCAKIIGSELCLSCRSFSCQTCGRKMDPSSISDSAQSLGIHLKCFLPAINFLMARNQEK